MKEKVEVEIPSSKTHDASWNIPKQQNFQNDPFVDDNPPPHGRDHGYKLRAHRSEPSKFKMKISDKLARVFSSSEGRENSRNALKMTSFDHLCVSVSFQSDDDDDDDCNSSIHHFHKSWEDLNKKKSISSKRNGKSRNAKNSSDSNAICIENVPSSSSLKDINYAKLLGVVTASAATIVNPVIMIGAIVWSIGLYKGIDNFLYLDDETMRKIFWFDADLSELNSVEEDISILNDSVTNGHCSKNHSRRINPPTVAPLSPKSSSIDMEGRINFAMKKISDLEVRSNSASKKGLSNNVSAVTEETVSNSSSFSESSSDQQHGLNKGATEQFENLVNIVHVVDLKCDLESFLQCFIRNEKFCEEFQSSAGDIEIEISPLCTTDNDEGQRNNALTRDVTFKTLTKSYFGPTYASAKKTTSVILNDNDMCVTNITKMHNIPYSDKFHIEERWVLVTIYDEKLENPCTTLTISYDIPFVRGKKQLSPYLEGIISSKTVSGLKERAAKFIEIAPQVLEHFYINQVVSQDHKTIEGVLNEPRNDEPEINDTEYISGSIEVDFEGQAFVMS